MTESKKIYFPHLDLVRFVAAFMVVILHSYEAWSLWFGKKENIIADSWPFLNKFLRNMGFGVDVFFLISGFLITYILLEEKKRTNRISIFKFMMRRSLRIWPLYFLIIAIAPFLVEWLGKSSPEYWYNIFFVNNFRTIKTTLWVYPFPHFWSICIEEHFYLIWPFVVAFIPKKWLLNTCAVIILGSIAFRVYSFYYAEHVWYTLYLHTLSRIDVIVLGAIGAIFYSKNPFQFKISRTLRFTVLGLLILSLTLEPIGLWSTAFLAGFKKYIYVLLAAFLLLDFNFSTTFKHFLPNKSFVHYLGKVSYGIYMYSAPLNLIIIKKIMLANQIKSGFVFFLLSFSLSIIIPIISYELIEKHFLKLTKYFRVIKTDR